MTARRIQPRRKRTANPAAVYVTFLSNDHYLWQCRNCDWTLETATDEPIEHVCGRPEVIRLGDRIKDALEKVGVTEERWMEVKGAIGLPKTCNCDARRQWINALDERLGLGEKLHAFQAFIGWKSDGKPS